MKKISRILAAALAAVFMVLLLPVGAFAANLIATKTPSAAEDGYVYSGWNDIPLLVIKVNYAPENGTQTLIKTTDDTYWYEMLFGEGEKSMKSYFETCSDGHFRFVPAKENYVNEAHKNVANDGIIEVSIKSAHPAGSSAGSTSSNDRQAIINAAMEFVDFSVYDTNGDGKIEKQELAIAFISAGYEYTRAGSERTPSFNAYYSGASMSAGSIGLLCGFIRCGEMMNDTTPLTVGSFCHEISHFLGAVDLYTNKSWGGANSPAGKCSVMAGNGSAGKMAGELNGQSPSYLDAWHLTALGFYPAQTVGDGEYTLYSRQSKEGKYNILKIETPNPDEYYLIENRYWDNSSTHFDSDTNYDGTRGVIIWHVDGTSAKMFGGGANNGAEIGVAALAPRKEGAGLVFPANSGVFGIKGQIFDCTDYDFPGSMSWHTTQGENWGDYFGLKIEILTDANHEMKIKVSGTKTADFPTSTNSIHAATTSITMSGQVTDFHGKTLTGMTLQVASDYKYENIVKSLDVTMDANGKYIGVMDGLTAKTSYYTRVIYKFDDGEFCFEDYVTTKNRTDSTVCVVSFFRGLSENDKAYEQKVAAGSPIEVKFPMNKAGYVFAGWYTDADFTNYYEVSNPCEGGEITLYAKWVEADKAAQLTVSGATLVNSKVNPAGYGVIGETFREPVVTVPEGKKVVWYADAACTTPFDFSKVIEDNTAVTIYAKFVDEGAEQPPETTGITAPETTAPAGEDTTTGGSSTEKGGISTGVIIAIVVVVVVVIGAVVVFTVIKPKKK